MTLKAPMTRQHKKEWVKCFDHILERTWLEWGGLSSIDREHPLFTEWDDGETNRAYHRGTSWFWINNMAAICLSRVAKFRYRKYIDIITNASIQETLWEGIVGHHAEISSAKELQSSGCLSQAWSNAMLYELLNEN